MKRFLCISGSPRNDGNSAQAIKIATDAVAKLSVEVRVVRLNDLNIRPCQGCGGCDKTGICVILDDMAEVYNELESADCILVVSPIYFGSVSAQVKAMVDRMQCLWVRRTILRRTKINKSKKGAYISVGALDKHRYHNCASSIMWIFFNVQGASYIEKLFISGVDAKGDLMAKKISAVKIKKLALRLVGDDHE